MGLGDLINKANEKTIILGGEEKRKEWKNSEPKRFKLSELGKLTANVRQVGELKAVSKNKILSELISSTKAVEVELDGSENKQISLTDKDKGDRSRSSKNKSILDNAFVQSVYEISGREFNLGTLFSQSKPGELTPNIGQNMGLEFEQTPAGELTTNIDNKILSKQGNIKQLKPGKLTDNIGNDLGSVLITNEEELDISVSFDNLNEETGMVEEKTNTKLGTTYQQRTELTPNIGNDLGVGYKQSDAGKLSSNIGKDLGLEFNQKGLDKLTPNISNDLGDTYQQGSPGTVTKNIGSDDMESVYTLSDEVKTTPELGENYKQPEREEKTIDLGVGYKQSGHGTLTSNVLVNDIDPVYQQPEIKHKTESIEPIFQQPKQTEKKVNLDSIVLTPKPEKEVKKEVVYEQPLNSAGDNDLDLSVLYDQPKKPKKEDLGTQYEYETKERKNPKMGELFRQSEPGTTSSNIKDEDKLGKTFTNPKEDEFEIKPLKTLFKNPIPKSRDKDFDLKSIPVPDDEGILKKSNKGNKLGNVYNK